MIRLNQNRGFTLVEVVMVIIILGILASIAVKSLSSGLESTRVEETKKELRSLAMAIYGNPELFANGIRTDYGYIGDVGGMPPNLDALVTNPGYGSWNGPYIHSDFAGYSDDFKKDAWGINYIYSGSNFIRSTGGGTDTIDFTLTPSLNHLLANTVSGYITDAVGNPPGDSSAQLRVRLRYPNGAGGYRDSIIVPNSSGYFSFEDCVPIGNHTIEAIYASTDDTVLSYVSVVPKSNARTALRFPGSLWASSPGGPQSGSGLLEYVAGSARAYGGGNASIEFTVQNNSDQSGTISWIRLTYAEVAYYQKVTWDGGTLFNNSNPRAGSNEQVNLSAPQNIVPYQSAFKIEIENFKNSPVGGANVDMSGKDVTVEFSDGTVISFTT